MTSREYCGRWQPVPATGLHGVTGKRVVCTRDRYHTGWEPHQHMATGWMWEAVWHGHSLMSQTTIQCAVRFERNWVCFGLLETGELCGTIKYRQSEDQIRAAGWKVARQPGGGFDAMCPRCANPDAETRKLLRELAASMGGKR